MAKAREIPGLDQDVPYAIAAARVVAVRTAELADHAHGVLDIGDIERVHDMRVATRRLRAALEVFRPCFPKDEFKGTLREVTTIADALGERRDRDVKIAALEQFAGALAAPDRPGIESLIAELRNEQGDANKRLASFVDEARLAALRARLQRLAAAAERAGAEAEEQPAGSQNGSEPMPEMR